MSSWPEQGSVNPITLCPHVLAVTGCAGCRALDEIGVELPDVPPLVRAIRTLVAQGAGAGEEHLAAELQAELDDDEALAAWVGDGS